MAIKVLQCNLNNCKVAQDLMLQWIMEEKINIVAIQEPWRINNSRYYANKKETAAIYCNYKISHDACQLIYTGDYVVAVIYKKYTIISCYCSPNVSQERFIQMLDEIEMVINKQGALIIICGDFNSKSPYWGATSLDTRGQILEEWSSTYDLCLINIGNTATCVRPQGRSVIDLTWSSLDMINKIQDWKVHKDVLTYSDHRYIEFHIDSLQQDQKSKNCSVMWNRRYFDKDKFEAALNWKCPEITGIINENIINSNDASAILDSMMKEACDLAMPRIKISKTFNNKPTYWWNNEIKEARAECIKLRRRWKRLLGKKKYHDANIIVLQYRNGKKKLKVLINKSKANAWSELIQSINEDPWGLPYKLVLNRLRSVSPSLTESLSSEILDRTLNKLFPSCIMSRNASGLTQCEWMDEMNITPAEMHKIIKKDKKRTNVAPGIDGIRFDYWNKITDNMIDLVAKLLNICMKEGKFPHQWKIGFLVLIPKGNLDLENPKLRPICLLNEAGKLLEKIIAKRLLDWMDTHPEAALSPNQFGFRKGRSTTDALVELIEFIQFAHNEDGIVLTISLDIQNAFNSLQWSDICHALYIKRFPVYLQKIIRDYLSVRKIEYRTNDGLIAREIEAGVPQGSVLGPLLWNITYDAVLRSVTEEGCRLMGYADDTLIIVTGLTKANVKRRATYQIATIVRKIEELHLKIVPEKTDMVLFTKGRKVDTGLEINIGQHTIVTKRHMKYLGILIDDKLTFIKHMKYLNEKVAKVTRALGRLMPNVRGPCERKRILYAHTISSVVLYGSPVWAIQASKSREIQRMLKSMQRKIATRVISAYRTISFDASTILARMPPYHLVAESRYRAYLRIRDSKLDGIWNKKLEKDIITEETLQMRNNWKSYVRYKSVAGKNTVDLILPVFDKWIDRNYGSINFRLTQILSGHGVFNSFLFRIQKSESDVCSQCSLETDTVSHTVERCSAWNTEREKLRQKLNIMAVDLRLSRIVKEMLSSHKAWEAVIDFTENVMRRKEEDGRRQRAE